MKILDDAILQDRYDVIVIGSGLSGLTAAALLANRGLQTLLAEHHYMPGGLCTTLRRRGFSFDTGTALVYGFGERGLNPFWYLMNELEQEIDVIKHKALFRISFDKHQVVFWPDIDKFLEELIAIFPNQRKELKALYSYLLKRYNNVIAPSPVIIPPTEIPPSENLRRLIRHPLAMISTLKMLNTSTEKLLAKFITAPKLMAFFDKLTSAYCYCTVAETPAILSATMFIDNHIGGAYYPACSPQILASTLEKSFESNSGQVLLRNRVEEIIIEDKIAKGVRLANGIVLYADRIVSSATVWNLYGKLIKPEHIKPERIEWTKKLIPTYASVVLYIAVDAKAIPQGTLPMEMLIANMKGVNQGDVTLYISSIDDPSICPAGTHAITVIGPTMDKWPGPFDKEYRSAEYEKRKQDEAKRILNQIEERFPGFIKHILFMEIGTPSTIERYTLKNGGAVGGPKQAIGQELMKRLHARSEWKNLYLCGDSTVMGMGAPAVAVSGIGAANVLLRDVGLPEYRLHNFKQNYVNIISKGTPLSILPQKQQPVNLETAKRLARECEYCEKPGCANACPAKIDIANIMRKIEVGNIIGAARIFREKNPLSEICGYTCRPNPPCEQKCNRSSFSDQPVRIAALQSWVCENGGEKGWSTQQITRNNKRVAVVGAGPTGLSCGYFLARLGFNIDILDKKNKPGGRILDIAENILPRQTAERDINGILRFGISFKPDNAFGKTLTLENLLEFYDAVFLATGFISKNTAGVINALNATQGKENPKLFVGGSLIAGQCSVVRAVAEGRKGAAVIYKFLNNE